MAQNGTLYVSQHPGSCAKSQTPFAVPESGLRMALNEKGIYKSFFPDYFIILYFMILSLFIYAKTHNIKY